MDRVRVPRDEQYIDRCLEDIDTDDLNDELRIILRNIIVQLCMEYGSVYLARIGAMMSAVTGMYTFRFKLESDVSQHVLRALVQQSPTAVADVRVSPCSAMTGSASESSTPFRLNLDVFLVKSQNITDCSASDATPIESPKQISFYGAHELTVADRRIAESVANAVHNLCRSGPLSLYVIAPSSAGRAGYYTLHVDGLDFLDARILQGVCASAPMHIETMSLSGVVGYPNASAFIDRSRMPEGFLTQPNVSLSIHIRECLTKPHVLHVTQSSSVLGKRDGQFMDMYYTDTDADMGMSHYKRQKEDEIMPERIYRATRAARRKTGSK